MNSEGTWKTGDWTSKRRAHGIKIEKIYYKHICNPAVVAKRSNAEEWFVVPNSSVSKAPAIGPLPLEEAKRLAEVMNAIGVPEEWKLE